MSEKTRRRAPALVVVVWLATATLAACGRPAPEGTAGGGTSIAPTTDAVRTIEVALTGSQVRGGRRTEKVGLGERVRIRASSDVPEELHVHTYDLRQALQPSQPGEVLLTATIPGRHEVEFERSGRQALTLEVG